MLQLIQHLSAPLYGLSDDSHTRDCLVVPVDTVLMDKRDELSQGVTAEQMVSIGLVGTGARAPERVWSARSVCVVVVASFFSLSLGTTTDQSVGLVVVFDRRRSRFGARFIGFVVTPFTCVPLVTPIPTE